MVGCCCGITFVFFIGLLMIVAGVVVLNFYPNSYKVSTLVLKPGTENYKKWIENETPMYSHFTLFNWTNPDEFKIGIKPNFVEMGPYVFRQNKIKGYTSFNTNYSSVSYNQTRTWFFEQKMSNGTLDDMVTAPDAVTASLAFIKRNANNPTKHDMNRIMLKYGKLSSKHTVREMIFDGYNDELLNALRNNCIMKFDYNKFGYFVGRNASTKYDGQFMIDTGVDDIQKLGSLTHWNKKTNNRFFTGECGKINGSAGDLFPPQLHGTKKDITIYSTDTCRFLNLSPSRKVKHNAYHGFEWIGTNVTLDNGEINPDEKCFCGWDRRECQRTGVVDCRKCHHDWPIYASFPHFYLANPQYRDNVTGLKPSKDKHQYSYILESASGRVLQMKARIQMNLLIRRDCSFKFYRKVPENTMMPLFFMEELGEFKGENKFELKNYTDIVLITVGGLIDFVCIILYLVSVCKTKRSSYEPVDESDPDDFLIGTRQDRPVLSRFFKRNPCYQPIKSRNSP